MIRLFSNNIDRTLADAITDIATTLTLDNAAGLSEPETRPNYASRRDSLSISPMPNTTIVDIPEIEMLTILGEGGEVEVVRMTGRAGNVCTVVRGQEGTTAQAWASGSRVVAAASAGTYSSFIQNTATHARGLAIDDHSRDLVSVSGYASAQGEWALAIGPNSSADARDATAVGGSFAQAITECSAFGASALARGARSTSVGWAAQNLEAIRTTIIGALSLTNTEHCFLGGYGIVCNRLDNTAVGSSARSEGGRNVVIGRSAQALGYEADVGDPYSWEKVVIGWESMSEVGSWGSVCIGSQAEIYDDAPGAVAIGYDCTIDANALLAIGIGTAKVSTERTLHISALPAVPKKWSASHTTSDAAWAMCSAPAVIMSDEVDLKVAADVTAPIWTGLHFFPDEVGLIITAADGVTGQPTIRFGITGTLDKLLAATATTGLDAAHKRERFQTLASAHGEASLTAGVTVAATGTTLKGRFYWRGFAVADTV